MGYFSGVTDVIDIPMVNLALQHDRLKNEIEEGLREAMARGQFILGPNVRAFEDEVAACLGAEYAISCASGTDALHLALRAAGIKRGDEIITTPFTFVATVEAICYLGARPIFVDIDRNTFNIDPNCVESAITSRTRGILPVHLFGQAAEMNTIRAVAEQHELLVVEDCAHSFAASVAGRMTGTLGTAGCFSFYPTKNLACYGDGGMVVTGSAELAERVRELRNHGLNLSDRRRTIGYNSRLDELQAVVLRAKLKRIGEDNERRRRIADLYTRLLEVAPVATPVERQDGVHVYNQYTVLTEHRERVIQTLKRAGIESAVYYRVPLHREEVFAQGQHVELPVCDYVASRCLSLPMYPGLSNEQVHSVVKAVKAAVI